MSDGWNPCLPSLHAAINRRPGAEGKAPRAATCTSELNPSHQAGPGQTAQPQLPLLQAPGGGQQPSSPPQQCPKYNQSRRLAGNRDLCQPLAGASGRKVSVIGRGAGRAGSQMWVM